jgi:hypothetical protein
MVLLDSRLPKDSNGITFAIFGPMDRKLWFFQGLNKIWFLNSILISVWFRDWHVAWSDREIPVRVDWGHGPLDLKWSVRPRWTGTSSVKWFVWFVGSRSDGWDGICSPRVSVTHRRRSRSPESAQRWTAMVFWRFAETMEGWTIRGAARRIWLRGC